MGFTSAEDFVTLVTANFDHTNVGTIAADPTIALVSKYAGTSFPDNGLILVDDETLSRNDKRAGYRQEFYTLSVTLQYKSTDTTVIKAILTELDRVLNANDVSPTRSYEYQIIYGWNTGFLDGIMELLIEAKTAWNLLNT